MNVDPSENRFGGEAGKRRQSERVARCRIQCARSGNQGVAFALDLPRAPIP